jgi:osmotically-inducible protein OsmY
LAAKSEDDEHLGEELGEDYYAGYYWGNDPYRSSELSGRRSDEELEKAVLARLESLGFSRLEVRVSNAVAILSGTVQDYVERRKAGAEVWKIRGIIKVFNNLKIKGTDTAGPAAD